MEYKIELLSNVVGHERQKQELLNVIKWFKQSKQLKEKGISIPKGVVLFGAPGNGKSLLIKELISLVDVPVFVFKGEQDNVVKGIEDMFEKARHSEKAIIVIDEIDLLINKEQRVIRALQENLDGVESNDDVLVLTATNNIGEIPEALLRNGRLEKLIKIPHLKGEAAVKLFKKYFKEFNVSLPLDLDESELEIALDKAPCSAIKAIVNDCVLRNGFENITEEMIFASINNIQDRVKENSICNSFEIALHESGHAVMAYNFPKFYKIKKLSISDSTGFLSTKAIDEEYWPYSRSLADIQINMAGVIACKVILGEGSRGCEIDLNHSRALAYNLINSCGYCSCSETLPEVDEYSRKESFIKLRKNERKIERLLKRLEKKTTRYIKKNKNKVVQLAKLLFDKKKLKSSEILQCIESC